MFNIEHILETGGLLLVGLIIFAESGLLVGFILPGDSLLFTAGFFAGQGKLPIWWLMATIIGSTILGYQVGYLIGEKAGPKVFTKKDGIFFKKEYVDRTEGFFNKHGNKTILFARFVPIVRTFVSVMAGVGRMDKRSYLIYNILGAFLWAGSVTLAGYFLGSKIPGLDKYIGWTIMAAVLLTFGVSFGHVLRDPQSRLLLKQKLGFKK
jgi:membrane-associated protein